MTELEIYQVVLRDPEAHRSVFVLSVPQHVFERHQEALAHWHKTWEATWQSAGRGVPALLFISDEMTLTSLTNDQLHKAGLMRIEAQEETPNAK